ncbi:hypothetical protein [Rothia aerolata]|uniref:Uncharacterized protein n=1 Tax=Rothia aerolata TaxID=1812262 RepID=A0A917IMX5_9MICC|nr:hypothetical protein [Rothia aerolata]GGH57476.1 hypothetical protein GCM10007359_02640 [Rothia aerolata]
MPWWFWIILWSLLVLGALVWLVWHAYRVIIKGSRAYRELLSLNDNFSHIWEQAQKLEAQKRRAEREPGIFVPVTEAYAEYEQGKERRQRDRISRRIQKRDSLGQPQRLGDLRNNARKGATHG